VTGAQIFRRVGVSAACSGNAYGKDGCRGVEVTDEELGDAMGAPAELSLERVTGDAVALEAAEKVWADAYHDVLGA
jgi:hypothetical protein